MIILVGAGRGTGRAQSNRETLPTLFFLNDGTEIPDMMGLEVGADSDIRSSTKHHANPWLQRTNELIHASNSFTSCPPINSFMLYLFIINLSFTKKQEILIEIKLY